MLDILTAALAKALGYEDGCVRATADHKLFVDGFNSLESIHNYLEDLVDCTWRNSFKKEKFQKNRLGPAEP